MGQQPNLPPVSEEHDGLRLDQYLAAATGVSRARCQRAVREGRVLIDDTVAAKPSIPVRCGQQIDTDAESAPETRLIADPAVPLEIVCQGRHWAVLNKAAGQVVHPGAGRVVGSMVHGMIARFPDLLKEFPGSPRPGVVHRLDLGTSGVLAWALTQTGYDRLVEQFAGRQVTKLYLAWLEGDLRVVRLIDLALQRRGSDRRLFTGKGIGGKEALTEIHPICRRSSGRKQRTLALIRIYTGRTHQIRVHCAESGFPIVDDNSYGRTRSQTEAFPMLHAWRLQLTDPDNNTAISIDSPPLRLALDEEAQAALAAMRPQWLAEERNRGH